MIIAWEGTIRVAAPIEAAYRYLADLPRHREWAQSVERIDMEQPGDAVGIGARYLTYERQGLQDDRQPHQSLAEREGIVEKTLAEVRDVVPNRRFAWHAHSVPRKNIRADIAFEFAPAAGGGTTITQRITMRMSLAAVLLARLLLRVGPTELRTRMEAQWEASLRNIQAVLEGEGASGRAGTCGVGRGAWGVGERRRLWGSIGG
jgi:uncharacterized protein YndB with AHSA1/START domain